MKTPTLILHSDNDYRVPLEQGEQWFRALRHFGVHAEIVIFPRENHNLTRTGEPKHLVESLNWQLYWFDRFLNGNAAAVPPDAPARTGEQLDAGRCWLDCRCQLPSAKEEPSEPASAARGIVVAVGMTGAWILLALRGDGCQPLPGARLVPLAGRSRARRPRIGRRRSGLGRGFGAGEAVHQRRPSRAPPRRFPAIAAPQHPDAARRCACSHTSFTSTDNAGLVHGEAERRAAAPARARPRTGRRRS